jgi:zeta-carotene desaturase
MVDVIIIGGGLSGLATAVELSRQGISVALYEQSPKLGGRCYSYPDETTGDIVDNGQHVLIGAYHSTLRYLELIGTRHFLNEVSGMKLPLYHPAKGFSEFRFPRLPRPFDLLVGIMSFSLLPLRDRWAMRNLSSALRAWDKNVELKLSGLTVEQWLTSLGQSDESKKCFWYPIAISIMNEHPRRASALLFARSLRAAFFGSKSDSALLISTVGQTELYVNGAVAFFQTKNANIHTGMEVEHILVEGNNAVGIMLKDGTRVASTCVVSAVPYFALEKILPDKVKEEQTFSRLRRIESSPIVSIHLWFDREFMRMEYCGLIESDLQWIFNRRKITNSDGQPGSYISAVISAAYDYVDRTKEELLALALRDLASVFPESSGATLVHAQVIKEKRATFSPINETESLRPSVKSSVGNFYLAGDWTNTGLPATIEGAVRSGFAVAELIKSDRNNS